MSNGDLEKTNTMNGSSDNSSPGLTHQETARSYDGRFGPLAQVNTAETRLPAFGGELQPGLWKPVKDRQIANPGPLGLCGFALTTFILGCIQMKALGNVVPSALTSISCTPLYILAGSGDSGAPVKFALATTWFPSGKKFPLCNLEVLSRHPLRFGLISGVHEPGAASATGGRGSSVTTMGSGCGGATSSLW